MSSAKNSMSTMVSVGLPKRTLAERAMPAAGMGSPSKNESLLPETTLNLARRSVPQSRKKIPAGQMWGGRLKAEMARKTGAVPKEIRSAKESRLAPRGLPPTFLAKNPSRPSAIAARSMNTTAYWG